MQNTYQFISDKGSFLCRGRQITVICISRSQGCGIKSAVTPTLGGDCKLDQNTFLLEPVSVENLHNNRNARNFWCHIRNARKLVRHGQSRRKKSQKIYGSCG